MIERRVTVQAAALMDPLAPFQSQWSFARGLTRDLLSSLDEAGLAYSPGDGLGPLWKHFRHIGRVEEDYLRALETGKIAFDVEEASYAGGASREALLAYLDDVDAALRDALTGLDFKRRVDWFGESIDAGEHLVRLVNHETLHHGMFIVYLRLLGRGFPPSWAAWGL